jgi:hypothetical protein
MRVLIALALVVAGCGASHHPVRTHSSRAVSPASVASLPSGSSAPVTPAVSGCPPHAVTAPQAPFCYPLPVGFQDFSTRDDYAYGWDWRTLVALDAHDLIQVIAQPVDQDLDKLTDADALAFARQLALQAGALGVLHSGAVTTSAIDGARAYSQDAQYAQGIDAQNYIVMRGHHVVDISCQSTSSHAARVTNACNALLAGIVIG